MKSAYRTSHTGLVAGVPASWSHHYIVKPGFSGRGTGQVAQLVEQRTENPRVGSSILPLATQRSTPESVTPVPADIPAAEIPGAACKAWTPAAAQSRIADKVLMHHGT